MKESSKMVKNLININENEVQNHLSTLVKNTVEETLNTMLDAEADELCNAGRYERKENRADTRAGHYKRKLETKAGTVELKVPKLRKLTFESQIIDRYRRREVSVEEALVEMYLAGVSVRKVEDITEALWGSRVSSGTISNLNKKVYKKIDEWLNKPIEGTHPFVYLDGTYLKRNYDGEVRNVAILIAVGINEDGYREVLGVREGIREDKDSWTEFLRYLKGRGLKCPRLIISDKCLGLVESIADFYPGAKWQRCMVHFLRNILSAVPWDKKKEVSKLVKTIFNQEDKAAAIEKAKSIVEKISKLKLRQAAKVLHEGYLEALNYMDFPSEYARKIRTNNILERLNSEVKRRTKVVGTFPDGQSAIMLVAARLRYLTTKGWGTKRYLNMEHLKNMEVEQRLA
jgi:putative transposase